MYEKYVPRKKGRLDRGIIPRSKTVKSFDEETRERLRMLQSAGIIPRPQK